MLKLIAGLITVITAALGYLSFKYETTSFCEAAQKAATAEYSAVYEESAEGDFAETLKRGVADYLGYGRELEAVQTVGVAEHIEGKSAIECAYMVAERELSPSSFREGLIEDLRNGG